MVLPAGVGGQHRNESNVQLQYVPKNKIYVLVWLYKYNKEFPVVERLKQTLHLNDLVENEQKKYYTFLSIVKTMRVFTGNLH